MPTELERLVVSLEANIKQYERQLSKASNVTVTEMRKIEGFVAKSSGRMVKDMAKAGGQAGAGFSKGLHDKLAGLGPQIIAAMSLTAIATAVYDAVKSLADLGDAATDLGMPVNELQTWNRLAIESGQDAEFMQKALSEVAEQSGDTGSALAQLFTRNHVTMSKDVTENMKAFSDLLQRAVTPAEQLGMATDVLGTKVGRRLAEALRTGGKGFDDLHDSLQQSGKLFSQDEIARIQDIETEWNRLTDDVVIGFQQAVLDNADAIEAMTAQAAKAVPEFIKMLDAIISIGRSIEGWMQHLPNWMTSVSLEGTRRELEAIDLALQGKFVEARQALRGGEEGFVKEQREILKQKTDIEQQIASLQKQRDDLGGGAGYGDLDKLRREVSDTTEAYLDLANAAKAPEASTDLIAKRNAAQQAMEAAVARLEAAQKANLHTGEIGSLNAKLDELYTRLSKIAGELEHISGIQPPDRYDPGKLMTGGARGGRAGTKSEVAALMAAADELGTSASDLATVIAKETGGTFSPSIQGGAGGKYLGAIQFGPAEQKQFGVHPGQTLEEQLQSVVKFLKARGFKPGMDITDLYSTILAGSPGHPGSADSGGTVAQHVAGFEPFRKMADKFLAGGGVTAEQAARQGEGSQRVTDDYKKQQAAIEKQKQSLAASKEQLEIDKAIKAENSERVIDLETQRKAREAGIKQGSEEYAQLRSTVSEQVTLETAAKQRQDERAAATEKQIGLLERQRALAAEQQQPADVAKYTAQIDVLQKGLDLTTAKGKAAYAAALSEAQANQTNATSIEAVRLARQMETEALERQLKVAEAKHDEAEITRLKSLIAVKQANVAVDSEQGRVIADNAVKNEQNAKAVEHYNAASAQADAVGSAIGGALKSFATDVANGVDAVTALKNALSSLASQLLDMGFEMIMQSLKSGLSGGAAGGGAGLGALLGLAGGGSFKVKGKPGTDSNVVPLALTRGEEVHVTSTAEAARRAPSTQPIRRQAAPVTMHATMGDTIINMAGSADRLTVREMDERLRANNARQMREIERNFGAIAKSHQQLRAP